jgi:hypothetical protein
MGLSKVPKSVVATRLAIGIGFAVVGYFVFKKIVLKKIMSKTEGNQKNFLNADGNGGGLFVSKFYDANHKNSDGTLGATWISYNDSNLIGYWQSGMIKEGTIINSIM